MDEQDYIDIYKGVKEAPDNMSSYDIRQYMKCISKLKKEGEIK